MNANEAKWNEVSISRLTTNVLQQKVIIFRCEPSERTLSVRLNFQIFPSLVAPLSSSLSYIIIFFYKLTFNSTPFHLLTPSSCIGSRLLSSSRYYYFSLFLFLSFPTHSSRFLSLFDRFSDSLFRTLCHPLYIYITNIYIYLSRSPTRRLDGSLRKFQVFRRTAHRSSCSRESFVIPCRIGRESGC